MFARHSVDAPVIVSRAWPVDTFAVSPPHSVGHGRHAKRRWPVILVSVLLAVLLGGVTYALWMMRSTVPGGVIMAGDLALSDDGVYWSDPGAGLTGTTTASLADLVLTPGDTLTVYQRVGLTLEGDNLKADVTAAWANPPTGFTTATWTICEGRMTADALDCGQALDTQDLTQSLAVNDLTPSGDGPTRYFTIAITLTSDDTTAYVDDFSGASGPDGPLDESVLAGVAIDLGSITVTANQIRTGEGFVP